MDLIIKIVELVASLTSLAKVVIEGLTTARGLRNKKDNREG